MCTMAEVCRWTNRRDNLNYNMKLPSIGSTPVSMPRNTPLPRRSRCLSVTPLRFPTISSPAQLWTGNQSIPRLDPLHPPRVDKRTVSLETPAVHHHNHQRSLIMQRREHYRYHQVWRKPLYGTSSEREECRKEFLDHLKRQMEEKSVSLRLQLATKAEEAEYLQEVDRLALSSEKEKRIQHSKAMMVYRDENKRLMEENWRVRALMHSQEALKERELLRLNPINWSGTLK